MANIKKAYQPIISLLAANMSATVGDIFAEIEALAAAKTGGGGSKATAHHKDEDGTVIAVRCGYFELWFPVVGDNAVEFGSKVGSPTGLNSMCKAGVSAWTKQQRTAKQAKADLLDRVAAGEIAPEDIATEQEVIEEARTTKASLPEDLNGYDTLEELLETL